MKKQNQSNTIVEVKGIRTIQLKNHSSVVGATAIEVAEIKTRNADNETTHFVVIVVNPEPREVKSRWISGLIKLTGWKCSLYESLNNSDPLIFIDKNRKRVFIRKDLLKLPVRHFIRLIEHLIEFIVKSSTSAYEKLQNETKKMSIHLNSSLSRDHHITINIRDNRLVFPSSLELSAEDFYIGVIAYDNNLILRSSNYNMSAMINTIFPLTAIEAVINFDGVSLGIQLPNGIRDALGDDNHSVRFKIKKLKA